MTDGASSDNSRVMRALASAPYTATSAYSPNSCKYVPISDGSPSVSDAVSVWLGVSVENQQWAEIRIPALLDAPAAVRFRSWLGATGTPCTDSRTRPSRHGSR